MTTISSNKRRRKEEDDTTPEPDDDDNDATIDKISSLPDDLLRRILTLLPTKSAAQTVILSKRWGRVWASVPTFKVKSMYYHNRTFFNRFMDKYSRIRRETNDSVAVFDLFMVYHGAKSRVDSWLDPAASAHVKEFKLRFASTAVDRKKVHTYSLPRAFLLRMRSLTTLKLEDLAWPKYDESSSVEFPSLKVLSLEKIYGLVDEQVSALLAGSPFLEELLLKNCVDLQNPKLKSPSLKSAKLIPNSCSCATKTVLLEAESVESLVYDRGYSGQACSLALVSCGSIKNLSLLNASFDDRLLKGVVSALPFLEELVLDGCTEVRHFQIQSETLERLVMRKMGSCLGKQATIFAPNLAFFSYHDESLLSLTLEGPTSFVADIQIFAWRMYHRNYPREWYVNLIGFLRNLDSCKELSIWVSTEKALIIPTELRTESPLPTLKHLKLKMENPLFRKRIFKTSMSWILPSVPAETLTIEENTYIP